MVTPKYLNFYQIIFIIKLTLYFKHHDKGCAVLGMEKITFLEVKRTLVFFDELRSKFFSNID